MSRVTPTLNDETNIAPTAEVPTVTLVLPMVFTENYKGLVSSVPDDPTKLNDS